jgi:hypothetical protein
MCSIDLFVFAFDRQNHRRTIAFNINPGLTHQRTSYLAHKAKKRKDMRYNIFAVIVGTLGSLAFYLCISNSSHKGELTVIVIACTLLWLA